MLPGLCFETSLHEIAFDAFRLYRMNVKQTNCIHVTSVADGRHTVLVPAERWSQGQRSVRR